MVGAAIADNVETQLTLRLQTPGRPHLQERVALRGDLEK